jgi:hypothetical protein
VALSSGCFGQLPGSVVEITPGDSHTFYLFGTASYLYESSGVFTLYRPHVAPGSTRLHLEVVKEGERKSRQMAFTLLFYSDSHGAHLFWNLDLQSLMLSRLIRVFSEGFREASCVSVRGTRGRWR